jgi:hypothetical protein
VGRKVGVATLGDGGTIAAYLGLPPEGEAPEPEIPPLRDVVLADGWRLRYEGYQDCRRAEDGVFMLHRGREYRTYQWVGPYDKHGDRMRVNADVSVGTTGVRLLHVTVGMNKRNPSWHDLRSVKRAFFGDEVDVMQVLPKESRYTSRSEHSFHLWAMPERWAQL